MSCLVPLARATAACLRLSEGTFTSTDGLDVSYVFYADGTFNSFVRVLGEQISSAEGYYYIEDNMIYLESTSLEESESVEGMIKGEDEIVIAGLTFIRED